MFLRFSFTSLVFAVVFAVGIPAAAQQPASQQTHCEDLVRLNLPRITVHSATVVPAGAFRLPNARPEAASINVPQFCRVIAVVRPELDFEIWLPERWNRKYEAVGNGGLAGTFPFNAMVDPLERGYAISSTNTGHVNASGGDATWALGHMDRIINYGQRGVHEMALASKALLQS